MQEESHFLIVGLGLLGGSYAQGLKRKGFHVSALDINPESIAYALEQGWIDEGAVGFDETLVRQADSVVFGLYPQALLAWIDQYQDSFAPGTRITDVTGVKEQIVTQVQGKLRPDVEFIASHPMAGREVSGVQYADCSIFEPANFIITPTPANTPEGIAWVKALAETLNFRHIATLSPAEHDKMVGFLSQLTHVIAVTLMNTSDNTHLVDYTGDSFRDLTRIAKINESLWTELFLMNKANLVREIDEFAAELAHFRSVLENEDTGEMKRLFRQSTQRRKCFDK
jgi:prephenate dehydrogenase